MNNQHFEKCTAFEGTNIIASGNLAQVAKKAKEVIDSNNQASILIFDDFSGELIEVDFRGLVKDVLERIEAKQSITAQENNSPSAVNTLSRGPGRPKIGVVSREVTLLPRHWDWLNSQPGGASVALRKLVEEARRISKDKDGQRHSRETTYRFMTAMAGDLPGYEEATRALFAGDKERFKSLISAWPADIRDYSLKISESAW